MQTLSHRSRLGQAAGGLKTCPAEPGTVPQILWTRLQEEGVKHELPLARRGCGVKVMGGTGEIKLEWPEGCDSLDLPHSTRAVLPARFAPNPSA